MAVFNFSGNYPRITGGPLRNLTYILHSFHLHWGGSEHTLNGHRFDAEIHIVFYNPKYGAIENALRYRDGIAVLAYVFVVKQSAFFKDSKVRPFVALSEHIREAEAEHVETKQVFSIFDIIGTRSFAVFSYLGSVTVPS